MAITDKGPSGTDVVGILRGAVNAAIGQSGVVGVACSGGVDSMALADAAIAVAGRERVVVVTVDHQLQAQSAEVARGVEAWAKGQGVDAIVMTVAVDGSSEAAAREARYAAFERVMEECDLVAMLIAHTQRDQAETVLMRVIRGTGPAGLAGMAQQRVLEATTSATLSATASASASNPNGSRSRSRSGSGSDLRSGSLPMPLPLPITSTRLFVRPLLGITRAQTEEYVSRRALPHWDDPMNRDTNYTRVRVREQVLPDLRELNPNIDDALVRLADNAREWLDAIDAVAAPFSKFPIDCIALAQQPAAIRKRALAIAIGADLDAGHLSAIDDLVCAPTRGEVGLDLPGGRIVRRYDQLDVSRGEPPRISDLVVPDGYELRLSQPGDRFRPVRLNGHSKKLSDLYIDMKLPRDQRALARVMVRSEDRVIVWAEHLGLAHGERTDLTPLPGRTDGSF
ncbi:MAG: tRNA lysidine(34) synthetase TilS [Kofleriaceae bacterium]